MRYVALTCVLLSSLAPLGCFEDLGPLPTDDDVGTTESSSGTSEDETSESGSSEATAETNTESSEATATDSADTTDTDTDLQGIYEPCGRDSTCPNGGACNQVVVGTFTFDICVPTGCDVPSDCPDPSQFGKEATCVEGECVIICEVSSDCGPGLVCSDGQCYFNELWGPCLDTVDCPPPSTCETAPNLSACLPPCNNPVDCPFLEAVCMANQCEIPCVLNVNCPDPMFCDVGVCRWAGNVP